MTRAYVEIGATLILLVAAVIVITIAIASIWGIPKPLATCSGGPVPQGGLTFMTTRPDGELYCTRPPSQD